MKILQGLLLITALSACQSRNGTSDAYGHFEAREIMLSAEVAGKILQMETPEGTQVKKNQKLGLIDTTQLHFKKRQLLASMKALKSKLQDVPVQLEALQDRRSVLQREKDRFSRLVKNGAATQKQLDDISGELDIVESQLAATKSQLSTFNKGILAEIEPLTWQLRTVEDQLIRCVIVSPEAGMLIERFREPGEIAMPGQPLFKIASLEPMTLRVYVSAQQLAGLKVGDSAQVLYDGPENQLSSAKGQITWIASRAEFTPKSIQTREERVSQVYAVKLSVPNDGFLKIGMPAEVNWKE